MTDDSKHVDLSDAKVLMVDDTPANIDVLRKVLAPEGYKLSFANSGEKALKIVERALPDLILLDVMMPGMDGLETCRQLKANPLTHDIPVVFITAKSDLDDLVAGFQVGAVDYIGKPFRQEEVCVRVRTHLQSRILMHQRERLISTLQATEERFRLLATWSPVGIFQADTGGKYVYTNHKWQEIFGLSERESLDDGWFEATHSEDRESVRAQWQESVEQKHGFHKQFRITHKQGDVRWVEVRATVQFSSSVPDRVEGFVGSASDITQTKNSEVHILQAKEAAESEMRKKSEFLAGMTHELRTPLNAIIGYSEMLSDDLSGEEGEDLDKITNAGKYLLTLINNVLDLSKVEANKMTLYLETANLKALVREISSTIMPLVKKNNNVLETEIAEDVKEIYADTTKVRQIIFNLLSNACKFTREGTIRLRIRRAPDALDQLQFMVSDTGIGMTAGQLQRVFHKYVQASEDTAHRYGGTGLGLVLSREFAQLMGGDISVTSEAGKGTTFTVRLPERVELPPKK